MSEAINKMRAQILGGMSLMDYYNALPTDMDIARRIANSMPEHTIETEQQAAEMNAKAGREQWKVGDKFFTLSRRPLFNAAD